MAMVEMVFVLPLLLLLIFTIAQFGLMFSRWLTLSNAVREGAREAVAFRAPPSGCDAGTVALNARERVERYASAGGIRTGPDPATDLKVEIEGHCTGPTNDTTVKGTYPFPVQVPFLSSLGTITLSYSSSMRNEG